jgi:DeoR/GlpR family transcriptional regulator of sugar metabolism
MLRDSLNYYFNTLNIIFVNLSSERRQRILEIVNQKRSISIDDLARYFPVSTITIRRDLDRLAEENLLRRVHGGAMALSNIVIAPKAAEFSANITEAETYRPHILIEIRKNFLYKGFIR